MNRRTIRSIVCTGAAAAMLTLGAVNTFAQDTVRVLFRVGTTGLTGIAAELSASGDCPTAAATVATRASGRDTLLAVSVGNVSVLHGRQQQNAPALVSHNRGNVSLSLQPQQYGSAEISVYTVNGRRVLSKKINAANGAHNISGANLTAGVYMLSVKGAGGNSFAARLAHSGGKLNINASFVGGNQPLAKMANMAACGTWTLTLTADGYLPYDTTLNMADAQNGVINLGAVNLNVDVSQQTYTLTVNAGANGTVAVEPSGVTTFAHGTSVKVTATPSSGYEFVNWTGTLPAGITATQAEVTFNITGNVTMTANFKQEGGVVVGPCTPSGTTFNNLRYGPQQSSNDRTLDLRLPSGAGPWPVVVSIHGGGFSGGSKSVEPPFSSATTRSGQKYATAAVNYKLSSGGKAFPESVEDVLAAIRFLKANASTYCLDTNNFVSTGFSAGGYFSTMVGALSGASTPHGFDKGENLHVSSRVHAVASAAIISNFETLDSDKGSGMGHCAGSPEASWFGFNPCNQSGANLDAVKRASPVTYVTAANCANLPPMLITHGTADNLLGYNQAVTMVNLLNSVCGAGKAELSSHSGSHNWPSNTNYVLPWVDKALGFTQ